MRSFSGAATHTVVLYWGCRVQQRVAHARRFAYGGAGCCLSRPIWFLLVFTCGTRPSGSVYELSLCPLPGIRAQRRVHSGCHRGGKHPNPTRGCRHEAPRPTHRPAHTCAPRRGGVSGSHGARGGRRVWRHRRRVRGNGDGGCPGRRRGRDARWCLRTGGRCGRTRPTNLLVGAVPRRPASLLSVDCYRRRGRRRWP